MSSLLGFLDSLLKNKTIIHIIFFSQCQDIFEAMMVIVSPFKYGYIVSCVYSLSYNVVLAIRCRNGGSA